MYTQFGLELSRASRLRLPIDASPQRWESLYSKNVERVRSLKQYVGSNPNFVVFGSGCGYSVSDLPSKLEGWSYAGVHWMPFHPDFDVDIVLSNHTCALEAALRADSADAVKFFIQSSGEIVPPIYEHALSIQWGNINAMGAGSSQSAIASFIDTSISNRINSLVPFIPAQPNVIFVLSALLIYFGAKSILFAGVDPLNPVHFYSDRPEVQLKMALAQCVADPWIGEWDGLSSRLPVLHRDTSYRVLNYVQDLLLSRPSAIGHPNRIQWFKDGFDILAALASRRSVRLAHAGTSEFMDLIGIPNAC